MSSYSSDTLLTVFLIFCRVGAGMMMAPGLSSSRIPMNVRLFLALTVSLAVSPLIMGRFAQG
ncbi:flagellar biosynthetic protein FliR, partial [Lysobacter sp. 2RAB21]